LELLSQSAKPTAQLHTACPHTWCAAHAFKQAPQCMGSDFVSTSQPLAAVPSQSAVPGEQTHAPATHSEANGHLLPHAPQLLGSSAALTSHPSTMLPLQFKYGITQALPH
jgi:hypothetical protein